MTGAKGNYVKRLYNPRTGRFEGPTSTVKGGHWVNLGTPPYDVDEDWVMLMKRTNGNP